MSNLPEAIANEFEKYNILVPEKIMLDKMVSLKLNYNVRIRENCYFEGNIQLNQNVKTSANGHFEGNITVDRWSNFNPDVEVVGEVHIGKFCAIARKVLFQGVNHTIKKPAMQKNFYRELLNSHLENVNNGPIIVGHDVWIGTRVIVLSGVKIGNGAVIGAGSIVTKDIEPYSVNVGVPAVKKKMRFSDKVIEQLEVLQWWNWDDEKIKRNRRFFDTDISSMTDIYELIVD